MPPKKKGKGRGKSQDAAAPETKNVGQPSVSQQQKAEIPQKTKSSVKTEKKDDGGAMAPPVPEFDVAVQKIAAGRGRGKKPDSPSPPIVGRHPLHGASEGPSGFPSLSEVQKEKGRGRGKKADSPPSVGFPKLGGSEGPPGFPALPQISKEKDSGKVETQHGLQKTGEKTMPQNPTSKTEAKTTSSVKSAEAVLETFAGLSLEHKPREQQRKFKMAARPGLGIMGQKIALLANYFQLDYKNVSVYHYDVDILEVGKDKKPGKSLLAGERTLKEDLDKKVSHVEHQQKRNLGKAKCREVIMNMVKSKQLGKYHPVYDGQKNIFTSQPLPFKEKTQFSVEYEVNGRSKNYCIVLKPVKKFDGSNVISLQPLKELYTKRSKEIPAEVLLVYDTVMNHRDPPLTQVQLRSSFFSLTQAAKMPLGSGLEIWFGYNQSVRLAERGPVVVINLAAKVFHQAGPVLNYACDVLQCDIRKSPKLEKWAISDLEKSLKGIRVQVTHQKHPRQYRIRGISKVSAMDLTFESDNKKTSIVQYYSNRYNTRLKYPNLPCLHMQTNNPSTYIPMELCEIIPGQVKTGKLSGDVTSKMIKNTAITPKDRFDCISKDAAAINNMCGETMRSYGLLMDVTFMKVDGRVLPAPVLSYAGNTANSRARPNEKGVWKIKDGQQFYKVKRIEKWMLISFANERFCGVDKLQRFAQLLVSSCRSHGMSFGNPIDIKVFDRRTKTEEAILYAKKNGSEFAIFVLSKRDNFHLYEEVKFFSDFKHNLVTQCMDEKTVNRINPEIVTNVSFKINVKLGGINHIILQRPQVFSRPVIVFGADAIHWARGYGYPSIAAVVGSLDPTASRYALTCKLQEQPVGKRSQEIIVSMKDIAKGILTNFENANLGRSPEKIIFFRDGVSEGQFEFVLEEEVSSLQIACQEKYGKILPITYIVVQKRHQTRFRPSDPREGVGKHANVPPGTTVDTAVTHPVFFDYFVCSHEGIQGTSKPAHYTVLHDDNRFTADELQQLSYFLCHTYVRCTRSVSLPAPILYADLAAARAKRYADLFVNQNDSVSSSGSDCINRPLPPHVTRAIESMQSFPNNMFYV